MVSTRAGKLFIHNGELKYPYGDQLYPVTRQIISVTILAATVDNTIFIADRAYELESASYVPRVAGTGGAATLAIKKCTGTEAPTAGDAMTTASADLVGTADTVQDLTLSATVANTQLADGDRIAIDLTGTLTNVVGNLTLTLRPLPA